MALSNTKVREKYENRLIIALISNKEESTIKKMVQTEIYSIVALAIATIGHSKEERQRQLV